jgi:hypothetical protein
MPTETRIAVVLVVALLPACALGADPSPAIAADTPLQTLRGVVVPGEVDVPSSWTVKRNASVIAAQGDGMQILLSSDTSSGDSAAAAKVACDGARELMPGATCTAARPIRLAGREWLEFTVTATVEKTAMTFLNFTYSGPEGTFTIIGQVRTEELGQKRDALGRYMRTFRFPQAAPARKP